MVLRAARSPQRTREARRDPGTVDWLRRRRAAHRRPAPSEGPPLRSHAPRRRTFPGCARTASCPSSATSTDCATLGRLRAAPFAVLHFAPPPSEGRDDPRTQKLIAALTRARSIPQRFVYISTSGVYGDCAGARVDEARPRRAQTPRARRRVAAEDRLRDWATRYGVALAILRVPGIYAETRLPLDRIRQGTPVLARRRRRVHQPHPRRRSRARDGRRAVPRASPTARTTSPTTPR